MRKPVRVMRADRLSPVGDGGPHWNTKYTLQALRDLLESLPGPEVLPVKREPKQVRRAGRRLKDAQAAELVEAYKAGATTYQLAERFGVKRQTVSAILKRNGVTPRWRRLTEANVDEAEQLYVHQGMSAARIADRLRVDPETVRLRLRKRGVQMRDPHDRN
ncbi:helix-turn-helix domain-containing protein [Streptomyces rubiginosohelvolus]|uniref:helix-turn-helix domain-containing protein n=1 Tax=Streptomyces rubiginosohelvolus TaxID=67362 RepID=UPI0037A13733